MPSVSDKQQRAMAAAAHGDSTIGIPQAVGAEFMRADVLKKAASRRPPRDSSNLQGSLPPTR